VSKEKGVKHSNVPALLIPTPLWTMESVLLPRATPSSTSPPPTTPSPPPPRTRLNSFSLVDAKPPPRHPCFGPKWREAEKERARRERHYQNHLSHHHQGFRGNQVSRAKPSVDNQPDWTMLEQIPFANFTKLSFAVNDQPEDLLVCGAVDSYDLPREHEGPGKFQSSPAAVSSQAA
jgi:hypothetical protein